LPRFIAPEERAAARVFEKAALNCGRGTFAAMSPKCIPILIVRQPNFWLSVRILPASFGESLPAWDCNVPGASTIRRRRADQQLAIAVGGGLMVGLLRISATVQYLERRHG
jgi:hypothetical protein